MENINTNSLDKAIDVPLPKSLNSNAKNVSVSNGIELMYDNDTTTMNGEYSIEMVNSMNNDKNVVNTGYF